eukprot:COSAG06_NODE_32936_length_497_cov_259.592965_2_plen_35_part_01
MVVSYKGLGHVLVQLVGKSRPQEKPRRPAAERADL